MTYTEVKNQFTTIESINTRLEEIFKIYDEYDVKANEVNDKHFYQEVHLRQFSF